MKRKWLLRERKCGSHEVEKLKAAEPIKMMNQ
jgi:hypothetical protein